MFRRKWSGLPADPDFPSNLKKLGYFVNEDDEIRSIADPDNYFKYFISRNERWNERQRYAMNEACENIVHARLWDLGLQKLKLPFGTTDARQPYVPILASKNIASASRVVVIFGESTQDLGILAHRVLGGPGGVNKGSMVSIVKSILSQGSSSMDKSSPSLILANCGQLMWLPSLGRTLTPTAWNNTRMKSAVHLGNLYTRSINSIPGNRTAFEHVEYILDKVLPTLIDRWEEETAVRVDIIAIGDGADAVEQYLDDDNVWAKLGHRLNCMALLGSMYPIWEVNTEGLKGFLRNRSRNYALSAEPLGTVLSGPDGNNRTTTFTALGCPVLSSGEPNYTECTLIGACDAVSEWLHEVAMCTTTTTTSGETTTSGVPVSVTRLINTYTNPKFEDVTHADVNHEDSKNHIGGADNWQD